MPPNSPETSLNTDWKCVCVLRVFEWKITDPSRGPCTAKLWNVFLCNIARVEGYCYLSKSGGTNYSFIHTTHIYIEATDCTWKLCVWRKGNFNPITSFQDTHTAVFNKTPHPICIYTGTEQGRTHRTGFAPGGRRRKWIHTWPSKNTNQSNINLQ